MLKYLCNKRVKLKIKFCIWLWFIADTSIIKQNYICNIKIKQKLKAG